VGRKIKVILTASDVIHSWWVPAFGMQQMTTPGNLAMVPLEVTKPGDYTGNCAYLCGPQHGAMGVFVRAVDHPTFMAWVDKHKSATGLKPIATVGLVGQTPPPPEANEVPEGKENPQGTEAASAGKPTEAEAKQLAEKGKDLYAAKCLGCHQPTGAGVPGVFPPLDGSEFVNGPEKPLVEIILKGKSGPIKVKGADYNSAMPPVGTGMSDEEVAELATYVRSAWSNKSGAIGPAQVKGLK
jgi:cytochrome c oxidase subunit 2